MIQQGGNQQLPATARELAYQQAIALCRQGLAAYHGFAILLLELHDDGGALHWIRQGLAIASDNFTLRLDLGVALLSTGQPQGALEALQALPPTARGEFYLGMAYRALRNHDAARRAFAGSFAMGNNDPYVLYELLEQDRALHNEKQGLQDFKMFYERFPHSAWLHLLLGNAYASRNDTAGAETEYREAAELEPKLPLVHFDLGKIAFDKGSYSEALSGFNTEIAVDPTFGEAYLYAGTSLRRLGKNQQATPYLVRAVKRDPNFPLAYRELAVAQIEARQTQAAANTLREGERRFPKEAAFPAQLARVLRQSGDARGAEEQSQLAETLSRRSNVQLAAVRPSAGSAPAAASVIPQLQARSAGPPHGTGIHLGVSSAAGVKAGSTSAAERETEALPTSAQPPVAQQLRTCIRLADAQCAAHLLRGMDDARLANNADYFNLKAEALDLLHQDQPALDTIQRAIALDPHRADLFVTQGRIHQKLGNHTAAIKSFLTAEQMRPGAEAPMYYLGMSFFMLGYDNNDNAYYDRAARHFKTALELNPRDDRAEFMLGVIDSIEFKLADAGRNLAAALKMNPRNPYYHLHYGLLLSRTGHPADGRREMKRAEMLDPSYPSTYVRLGDLDVQIGNYTEARAQLETAVRLDPHLSSAYYTLGRVYYHLGLPAESRQALLRFQQTKSEEQKETDPIGASINAVASRRQRR